LDLYQCPRTLCALTPLPELTLLLRDLLVAGVWGRPFRPPGLWGQPLEVVWFTDEDDIAANEQRMQELLDLFGEICQQYLPHPLETIRVGTTQSDDGTMDIEDFVAIADLVAGAVSCALTASRDSGALPSNELKVPLPGDLPEKAGIILDWLADLSQPFKRLVLLIEPAPDVGGLRAKHLIFKNPVGTSPAGWHGAHWSRP
jgi:hypothetical protein